MAYVDFVVDYSDDQAELGRRIIRNLCLNRIKFNKPVILVLTGDSGEGKSYIAASIADLLLKDQGIEFKDYINDCEVFTPHEYKKKIKALLFDKRLKKINVVILDEAREVVDAKKWFLFINQAISYINAIHRQIKPMVIIIVTQFIKDIDSSIRRTITYYGKCSRPLGQRPYLYLYKMWKDDRDIENPKLRKKRITGIVNKGSRKIRLKPKLRFKLPDKEIVNLYESLSYNAKILIVNSKLDAAFKSLDKDVQDIWAKVDVVASYFVDNPVALKLIVDKRGSKFRLKPDVAKMYDLNDNELKELESRINIKLVESGLSAGDKDAV